MAATQDFINSGRFAFHSSLAATPEERANPWLLLNRELEDGVVPVITDANSMTYVLHMKLGDELRAAGIVGAAGPAAPGRRAVRQHLPGRAADGGAAVRAGCFPSGRAIASSWLDAPLRQTGEVTELLESRLRISASTWRPRRNVSQAFTALNILTSRRFRCLAGWGWCWGRSGSARSFFGMCSNGGESSRFCARSATRDSDFLTMVVAENVFLLVGGLIIGTCCALVAIAPVFLDRGGRLPTATLALLLLGVLGTGLAGVARAPRSPPCDRRCCRR